LRNERVLVGKESVEFRVTVTVMGTVGVERDIVKRRELEKRGRGLWIFPYSNKDIFARCLSSQSLAIEKIKIKFLDY
jgi:hypothetical protein